MREAGGLPRRANPATAVFAIMGCLIDQWLQAIAAVGAPKGEPLAICRSASDPLRQHPFLAARWRTSSVIRERVERAVWLHIPEEEPSALTYESNNTIVQVNLDTDALSEMEIQLDGIVSLTASDFFFWS
jgi:hypothetical protein